MTEPGITTTGIAANDGAHHGAGHHGAGHHGAGHHGAGHHGAYGIAEYGFVLGSAGIWGASFILIAESLEHFAPGVVTFVRISVGALTLMAFKAARQPVERRDWRGITLLSIVWLAFPMTLYPIAQQHISSGLAGMLGASIPIFTAVLATVLHGLVPAAIHRVGILVGAIGIVVLGLPALGEGSSSVLGVVLIIAACVSYGLAFNVAVPLVQKYGSMPVFWRALLVSVPLTLPLALVGLRTSSFGLSSLVANVVLGAGGTAIAFVLLLALTARAGATRSSMITYLEAVVAFVLGTLVRHEEVQLLEVLGCATLLVGAWLASRASGPRPLSG
ncbi:MAG TPA: DMT family transporter [Ilumatobacteraceae bacterium]